MGYAAGDRHLPSLAVTTDPKIIEVRSALKELEWSRDTPPTLCSSYGVESTLDCTSAVGEHLELAVVKKMKKAKSQFTEDLEG